MTFWIRSQSVGPAEGALGSCGGCHMETSAWECTSFRSSVEETQTLLPFPLQKPGRFQNIQSIYIIMTCVETCNCTFEFGGKLWMNCETENPVLLSLIWFKSFKIHSSICCEYYPSIIKVVHVTCVLVFFYWKSSFFWIWFFFFFLINQFTKLIWMTYSQTFFFFFLFFPAEECGTKREGSEGQHRRHCYSGPAGSTTTSWAAHLRSLHS